MRHAALQRRPPQARHARRRQQHFSAALLGALIFAAVAAAPVRTTAATPTAHMATPTAAGPADAFERGVPRTAMLGYLQACRERDYTRAAEYLDLSHVEPRARAAEGPLLARQLKAVLDRTLWVDPESLSDAPQGFTDDGLPPRRDSVGTIQTKSGPVEIVLERVPRPDGVRVWKIAAATVAKVPSLYAEFGPGALGELVPRPLRDVAFLEIALWQWIGLVVLAFAAVAISWAFAALTASLIRPVLRRWRQSMEGRLDQLIVGPVRLAVGIAIFYAGTFLLSLSVPVQTFFNGAAKALVIGALTWLALRVIDIFSVRIGDHFTARGHATAIAMLPLVRRTVKVLLLALALLALLQNFGFNVTGLIAGLGVGGLAVALGAQETLKNFFGGLALIADQPVRVGDFCRFGTQVGTVEDMSLWSTRIRTLDRTVVSIPNAQFSTMQLENFARRDRIWLHATIGLRYETTADQLRFLIVELKKLLLAHPKVHLDPARVRFVNFNAYSLDLEIFAYVRSSDYNEFLEVQEDVFLRIMEIVEASGTGFAFPSHTVYMGTDGGVDDAKSRAAETQVQQWRAQNALWLPQVPPQRAAELDNTLDYPPKGSAARGTPA